MGLHRAAKIADNNRSFVDRPCSCKMYPFILHESFRLENFNL